MSHHLTVRITEHARRRCVEMGISTKVAKRIARHPSMVLPDFQGNSDRQFIHSKVEPEYVIILDVTSHEVVTVMHFSPSAYRERETG